MRAVWYDRLGPADEVLTVGTQPTPSPGPGEVLVRVRASGINPSDVKKRSGWLGGRLDHDRIVPHSDGAGMIEAVGEGVSNDRLGERVWLYNAQWQRADGTAAEYVALPSALAVPLLAQLQQGFKGSGSKYPEYYALPKTGGNGYFYCFAAE